MNIGISGPIGVGKTTTARYLASTHGLSYLRYSQILAEISQERDAYKRTLRELGWDIMSEGLQFSLNQRLLTRMEKGINYVADGLRHLLDFQAVSNHPPFYLLYVDASPHIRWQRLRSRDAFRTWDEFQEAEKHPVEGHLPFLRGKAYKVIQNKETLADLYVELDRIYREIQTRRAQ